MNLAATAAALAFVLTSSCAHEPHLRTLASAEARSSSGTSPTPSPQTASAGPSPWPLPAAFLAPLTLVAPTPVRSLGHAGGRYDIVVWASDTVAYRGEGTVADGFRVCAEHREAGASSGADLLTCLRRVAGHYEYAVTKRGSDNWLRAGDLPDCVACHDGAARGGVFGLPMH